MINCQHEHSTHINMEQLMS